MAILRLDEIGSVRSPVKESIETGWAEVVSDLVLEPRFAGGLRGIEKFSHVLVVFLMHQALFDPGTDLVNRPDNRDDMPEIGIFAQRARHRPNPIGTSAVKIEAVKGNVVTVRGLDAIDGTPLLDIKPYMPEFDRIESPVVPEWARTLMRGYF
ncbi:MAG: tRNA (N6-threonylcarbamoyladenosine(37)-N6)-methyltransferase TrmO [SAR202 cluster bacterium]|nr:tRNA (N6-threonylcarbamoyladenosine(37)-N6)-methyltransferase TrmO [SAR202 cluster bacterium]